MSTQYSHVHITERHNITERYAPRPHKWQTAIPPPPLMDKTLFERCAVCIRAFGLLHHKKHCANCGFVYCTNCCREKVWLVKFRGYHVREVRVCDYCKEFLKIDRMPEQTLRKMPVRALHEYIEAYGIAKDMPPVEKSDLISTILEAELTEYSEEIFRQGTPGFRDWFKVFEQKRKDGIDLTDYGMLQYSPLRPDSRPSSSDSTTQHTGFSQSTARASTSRTTYSQQRSTNYNGNATQRAPLRERPSTSSRVPSSDPVPSIERTRRPYSGSPPSQTTRPRATSDILERMERVSLDESLETAFYERERRQYSSTLDPSSASSPTPSPQTSPIPVPKPPSTSITDLAEILEEGIDISTLPTSQLLVIMRENNCKLPPGYNEREMLIERVQEMLSFKLSQLPPEGKERKIRDEDEDECKICNENLAEYCLVPCGHTGMCLGCARQMTDCPFCRAEIRHLQKLFRV